MSTSKVATGLAMMMVVAVICGYASLCGSDPTSEALAAMDTYHKAMKAESLSGMMTAFSDDWTNAQGSNKSEVRNFIAGAIAAGTFGNVEINMNDCKTTVTDDAVVLGPVYYGNNGYSYTVKKEADGVARIINTEPY